MTNPYQIRAEVIADSIINELREETRLTTMAVTGHRFILAEFNTWRAANKNSASSRAIPIEKRLEEVDRHIAMPVEFPREQPGMSGGAELDEPDLGDAQMLWRDGRREVFMAIRDYLRKHPEKHTRLHKSVLNRMIEPWMWHTIIVTATAWENFFDQRCNPQAQPEIRELAMAMRRARDASTPQVLTEGMWHTPYIDWDGEDADTFEAVEYLRRRGHPERPEMIREVLRMASTARCARVSYETHEGERSIEKDCSLYERLVGATPPHWSPLEHVATPWPENRQQGSAVFVEEGMAPVEVTLGHLPKIGNLYGWRTLRVTVEAQQGVRTFR